MATQTDHMKLTKPAYTDSADIAVINSNMDAIDTATSKILPVISGTTNNSGYTIASGEYFEANGKLYKANASIPTNQAWSSSATEQSDHGAINALNGNLAKFTSQIPTSITDFNSATTPGYYRASSAATNAPASGYWAVSVVPFSAGDVAQIAVEVNVRRMYFRTLHDTTTWTSWEQVALKSEITQTEVTLSNYNSGISSHTNLSAYKTGNSLTFSGSFTTNASIANAGVLFKANVTPKALANGVLTTTTGLYSIYIATNGNVVANIYGTSIPAGTYNIILVAPI